MISYRSH